LTPTELAMSFAHSLSLAAVTALCIACAPASPGDGAEPTAMASADDTVGTGQPGKCCAPPIRYYCRCDNQISDIWVGLYTFDLSTAEETRIATLATFDADFDQGKCEVFIQNEPRCHL